jgi:hypothetical protein
MLIPLEKLQEIVKQYDISIKGVLHVGAHTCEELPMYNKLGVPARNILWIDALADKVKSNVSRGIPNVYQAVVSDTDDQEILFHRTNNDQSSSILELGSHSKYYPNIVVTDTIKEKTVRIDTFFSKNAINPTKYTLWNFDIQGAEMKALLGGPNALQYARILYMEVNTEEVYKGCVLLPDLDKFLEERGFKRVLTEMTSAGWGDAIYVR